MLDKEVQAIIDDVMINLDKLESRKKFFASNVSVLNQLTTLTETKEIRLELIETTKTFIADAIELVGLIQQSLEDAETKIGEIKQ